MVDLEAYDYEPGSRSAVRATEGTVMSRIPPADDKGEHLSLLPAPDGGGTAVHQSVQQFLERWSCSTIST